MLQTLVFTLITTFSTYAPNPHDKDGWGLRIRLHRVGPFLQCESLETVPVDLTLINYSEQTREHDLFAVAARYGGLRFGITGPDGKSLRQGGGRNFPRDPFTVMNKLPPGECHGDTFLRFGGFYEPMVHPGRYRATVTMKIDGKVLDAPPVEFEVVEVPKEAVLVSHDVPLEGAALAEPKATRHRVAVQQVKVGDRLWLVYRRFGAKGGVNFASRIVELPGKVEMKVEGAYGAGKPLTVTYQDPNSATGTTTLKIHSIVGRLWRTEDEPPPTDNTPPLAPPPRAIKP